ncbi:MAG TPA: hypothetical protein DCL61_12095 [Cyanobacteria bacterium UBA12227]|nr:hypothetical protein [Cyanobacteria bacterium UBA12227]HAX87623.1 hypothetical protein [Cyanobacteria bacterium UBA11370]HBY80298.1 hypothetical protein [Cyanobacteria bacterium UBA11148]
MLELPLGIKHPLLPLKPLGQIPLLSKFLYPLENSKGNRMESRTDILLSPYGKTILQGIGEQAEETLVEDEKVSVTFNSTNPTQSNEQEIREKTNSDRTVVELLSETREFPLLPTVVNNLTQIELLGQSTALGEESLQTLQTLTIGDDSTLDNPNNTQEVTSYETPQKTDNYSLGIPSETKNNHPLFNQSDQSTSNTIPTSWSSIAELIGETSPSNSQESAIQQLDDDEFEEFIFTPDGFRRVHSSQIQLSDSVNSILPERINKNNQQASFSQNQPESDRTPTEIPEATVEIISPYSQEEDIVSEANLEILAQEVYKLVRQRLERERERNRRY